LQTRKYKLRIFNLISIVALSTLRLEDLRSGSNIPLRNSDIGFRDATSTETKNKMQSGLFLDVVVGQRTSIFELLTSEDEALLIRWNTLLVLDLAFNHIDGIGGFNLKSCELKTVHPTTPSQGYLQSDGLSSESLHENLKEAAGKKQS